MTNIEKILKAFTFKSQDQKDIVWTPTQKEILTTILNRQSPDGKKRIHIMTHTRYGKSSTVGAGVLIRAVLRPEKWGIVAGTKEKARIIMEYISGYALDDPIFRNQLELEKGGLERLRRERSRDRLTFKRRGEVRVFSADVKNRQAMGEALMGFGAPNIVEDESALVDDEMHSKVMRMLGDSPDNFLIKVGNPFRRNHFLESFQSDRYYKIIADWQVGLREGRITEEFLAEMRKEYDFDILYECKFPPAERIDKKGYMPLLTEQELEQAMTDELMSHFGQKRIGGDVAGGGKNYSVVLLRSRNLVEIISKDKSDDTMGLVGRVLEVRRPFSREKPPIEICIDKVGTGKGAYDRLCEQVPDVIGVVGGEEATDKERFFNKRAENYWRARDWILTGGKLKKRDDWYALLDIKYKIASDRRIKIMSKEEMVRQGIDSPDVPDALATTFNNPEVAPAYQEQSLPSEIKPEELDPYARE